MCLQIPSLAGYAALQTLELSYNSISSLQPLTQLQNINLAELYVANNAVQLIEVLNPVFQTGTTDLQCRSYQSILCSMYYSQLSMHVALNSQYGLGGSGSILLGKFLAGGPTLHKPEAAGAGLKQDQTNTGFGRTTIAAGALARAEQDNPNKWH